MKIKKRILSVLLLAVMCMNLLAGCGSGSSAGKGTGKKPVKKAEYSLEETVIADNEYYSASVISVSANNDNDCVIEFSFTNKTEEELYMSTEEEYVNGYTTFFMWSDDNEHAYTMGDSGPVYGLLAAPGETVTGEGSVSGYSIKESGKEAVEEFEAGVIVSFADQEDIFTDQGGMTDLYMALEELSYASSKRFTIYPTGLDADTIEYAEPEEVKGEQVLEDNEYFTYIIQNFEKIEDEKDSYYLDTYVENKMDETIVVRWDNVKMNGKDVELYQSTQLSGGKRELGFNYITGELTEGFPTGEDIEEISFTLRAYENGDTTLEPIYEADFTYKIQ